MPSLDLNNTFGALLLGTVFSAVLYGVTCLQSWYYFQNYSDALLVKILVGSLLVLETLHSAFSIHALYYYVILNYLNPTALLKATWSAASVLIVTTLITSIVRTFYIWRVYIVSRKFAPLAIFLAALELTRLDANGTQLKLQFFADFKTLPKIVIPQDIALSLATAFDILIAVALTIYLHNGKTGISGTNKIVNQLMVHAINNGILTSLADVLCLSMGIAEKDNLIYLAIYQCIGNLYTNSMLATLNARKYISHGRQVELVSMESSFNQATLSQTRSLTVMGNVTEILEDTSSKDLKVSVQATHLTSMG